jgi:hypothetical protein
MAGDLGLGISTTLEILFAPVVLETVDVFDVAVTFADAGKVSLELRCEEADGWFVDAGRVVTLGAGKLEAGDFVSRRLEETADGDFASTEELSVEVFDCVAVVDEEDWETCDDAPGVGKRMPQNPATGSVNSNSTYPLTLE